MRLRRFVLGGAASAMGFGVGTLVLIAAESWLAKHRRYVSSDEAPIVSGSFGTGAEVRLVIFGDSTAVGLGVSATEETVGGRLAELLAGTGKRVRLDSMAVSGARAADLEAQVARALVHGIPDVAVVIIGGEDATRLAPLETFESDVAAAVSRLTAAGAAVVVATCPDLGAAQNFAQPLRELMSWSGRRVGAATEHATLQAGGVAVDLAARTGAVFRADPGTFSADGYHPSADGYQLWALALYPAVYEASRTAYSAG